MEIFNKIKKEEYTGGLSIYNSKMREIRWENKHSFRYTRIGASVKACAKF